MARTQYRRRRRKSNNDIGVIIVMSLFILARLFHLIAIPLPIVYLALIVVICYGCVTLLPKLWKKRRYENATMNELDRMTGEDFEHALLLHLKQLGWKVRGTPKTGDFGADLIGTDPKGISCVIQSKRWKAKVGVDAVQQVIGAKAYYKTERAVVVTNNWLTKNARELAQQTGVEVWERGKVQWLLSQSKKQHKGVKVD